MKIKKFSIMTLCIVSLFACEKESSDSISNERATLENQKIDPTELARNFDKQLPPKELIENANAYRQLDHEEMAIFINERHKMSLEEGATIQDANTARELMLTINDYLQEEYGQSYASADSDLSQSAYKAVIQNKNIQIDQEIINEKFFGEKPCDSSWSPSGTTPVDVYPDLADIEQKPIAITFKGRHSKKGNCYLVFKSEYYNDTLTAKYIYPITYTSHIALGFVWSDEIPSKEESNANDSSKKSLEFMVEESEVSSTYAYLDDAPERFAEDTKILLE